MLSLVCEEQIPWLKNLNVVNEVPSLKNLSVGQILPWVDLLHRHVPACLCETDPLIQEHVCKHKSFIEERFCIT